MAASYFLLFGCGGKVDDQYPNSEVIARVGDRVITKSEFIRRVEYTPRPTYCRGDNSIHKKIVLNSLIAEKLLALDILSKPEFKSPDQFDNYIKGRREQAMRQLYRYEHGPKLVSTTDEELKRSFKNASREFNLGFITLPDSQYAHTVRTFLDEGESFESVYARIFGTEELEIKELTWFDDEERIIRDALYSQPVERGAIVGPLKLSDGKHLILKVIGWNDKMQLSESANQTLWEDVVSKVEERKGNKLFNEHTADLMRGKSFILDESTFRVVVDDLAEKYLMKESDKGSMLNQVIWDMEKQHLAVSDSDLNASHLNQKLFRFDNEDWSVQDFYDLVASHPLVFREKSFEMSDFARQVKLSIADLLKDHIITGEAYANGYSDRKEIVSYEQMWQDQYFSGIYKEIIRFSISDSTMQSSNSIPFIEGYMNPIIDSLQTAYSNDIYINFDAYEDVKLTRIDMFVAQDNVPYPVVVPPFPQITTDYVFDYGSKLESE
ncbi:MAG: hypothetical protein HOJ19_01815 [Candidatus Marinimicrobia bacterium]|nr:hypothetical protein [Candidatus Neomarinimicrobiota bacterium]MBT3576582.1 hypothetical protein [Candidatus Neomarinimicrobiota bacterium]MBT3680188.1 hypothetical protein [Candidatus Neomarinimicrobiota bacterium]MBT3949835.1 hypothetical protein [Candidatus Neomarinimicrobiota bacterium]MBT5784948.1 hypothetical protein [Candidatus Neomarinimicrobiota bacterium]